MNRITPVRREWKRRQFAAELGSRQKIRELASFLGLDAGAVAEGLLEAVERDPALRRSNAIHRHAA